MVIGPETSDVTNNQDPERHYEQGAQTAALPAGHNADMRTLVRRLSAEALSRCWGGRVRSHDDECKIALPRSSISGGGHQLRGAVVFQVSAQPA